MAETFTQKDRFIEIITSAGTDVLLLDSVSIEEGISRPFRISVFMLAQVAAGSPGKVKPHDLVGTSMTVRIDLTDPVTGIKTDDRFWTGMCERFSETDGDDDFARYTAVIVPWFSFLNYASNCRIFQKQTVVEVVQQVVALHGYSGNFKIDLAKQYTPRDYCVQYRETDFAFISRLLESEGIYYYFEHDNGSHKMVLADGPSKYLPMPKKTSFKYSPVTGMDSKDDTIRNWSLEEEMHAGKWTYRDYHHESPTNHFEVSNPSVDVAKAGQSLEVYDYPGDYAKVFNAAGSVGGVRPEGDVLARVRMEKEETRHTMVKGASGCRVFTSGYKFDVEGGTSQGSYLLTSVGHSASQSPTYYGTEATGKSYSNRFTAIPASRSFVPEVKKRPVIPGMQTARVIDGSPSGNQEEIWPDKYGRVLVRFPWDREAKYSCWLRVVQPWAGKMWGQQWIPRVGDEVAVTFLEGDPDCPVIVGSIYNADNMPIFSLPDNKTQSGILTHSTKGGGASNYNMLRFEDKIGCEEIHMQAEKDLNSLIKHDETRTVGDNRTTTIHVNDTKTVETGDDKVTVQQGNQTITVHQKITTVSEVSDINTTANQHITTIAQNGHITIDAQTGHVSVSSPQSITLSVQGSTIVMTPGEIRINAPKVNINS